MCGIAGGTGADSDERRRVIEAQLATLCRRGPDASGYLPGDVATVGQTRLSVIDLAHGDPPVTDESGQVRVALNGEIYNFRELRDGLLAQGHTFGSYCDTEVIAHLAESLEPVDLARALEGMFAFAVWDTRRERLTLGRDRMGKKPLYYWTNGTDLVFGSEIKALLADPRVPRTFAVDQLPAYLSLGYVPSPATFFEGIRSVPPASVLTWSKGRVDITRYWDVAPPRREDLLPGSAAEHAAALRTHLRAAVERRLIADVPLGAFLSGGVDSAAVVGLMAELQSAPVRTFCIGFHEPKYDEREWAQLVSRRFATEHAELVVEPDASRLLDEVLTACDQPFADSSAVPTYLLAEMTRRHVTVALSGDGGDELFAGYERFAAALALSRAQVLLPSAALRAAAAAGSRLSGGDVRSPRARAARLLRHAAAGMPGAYAAWVQVFEPEQVRRLTGGSDRARASLLDAWRGSESSPVLSRLLDLNRRTYLLDDLLVKVDRMSMAHGLEVRSPLLDRELVEFAVRIPPGELVRGTSLKRLFKTAVADLVPEEIRARPKRGFGVPLDEWFRGPLAAEAQRRLAGSGARLHQHVSADEVRRIVDEHQRGAAAHGQRLWSLLMLERFLEREGW